MGTFAAAAAILLALTTGSAQAATVTVAAMNYEFQPATRTIAVGDVVRWTFSGEPHSVTSRDGLFDSGVTNPGGSFQFTFATAGTYRYYCQVHPEQMFGTIVVKASASPAPTLRPTPSPTIRPTTRPTAAPTPTPSPAPSATQITPPVSSPSPSPAEAESAGASPGVVASASSSVPPPAPGTPAPSPTSAGDSAPVAPLAVIVLGVLVVGGLVVARRRRAS